MNTSITNVVQEFEELDNQVRNLEEDAVLSYVLCGILKVEVTHTTSARFKVSAIAIPDCSLFDVIMCVDINYSSRWIELMDCCQALLNRFNLDLIKLTFYNEEDEKHRFGQFVPAVPHKGTTAWGKEYEVLENGYFVWCKNPNEVIKLERLLAPEGWRCCLIAVDKG